MMRVVLSGVYAAAVTPLKPNGDADLSAVAPFLGFLASRGCSGALLLGTTGEGPSFSEAERGGIWREAIRVREKYPDFRLLAGSGTPSLTETVGLTKLAFDIGFDAVVTLPPYYFRNATEEGLFRWFQSLINSAVPSDGMLLGYHIPGLSGIGFSLELVGRLKHAFPVQFAGLKDSSHDRAFGQKLGMQFGRDLAILNGTDSDFSWALRNQAAGCITAVANLISPFLREIYDASLDSRELPEVQASVDRQRNILETFGPFAPSLKLLLHRLHGFPRWSVRPPLVELTQADEERILAALLSGNRPP